MALTDTQVRDLMGLGFTPFQVNYLRPLIGATGGGLAGVVSVKDFGAVGNGIADDTSAIQQAIYAAFGTDVSPNGSNYALNKQLYFPPGNYVTTSVLSIPPVQGGIIYGAGRFTTTITNNTNSGIFKTNNFNYSTFSDMQLQTNSTTAVVFDLNSDGINHNGVNSSFFCEFKNLYVSGGSIGMQCGAGGFTCSDNLYTNCLFQNTTQAGIKFCNFNSLDHVIINCGFANCPIGIYVFQGSVATVISSGFAGNTSWDIQILNGGGAGTVISGVRTESVNFISSSNCPTVIQGCGQSNTTPGFFAVAGSTGSSIDSCISTNGSISVSGSMAIRNFKTGRTDWLSGNDGSNSSFSNITMGSGTLFNKDTTFAMLPPPNIVQGSRGNIKDATVGTFGSVVSAGGGTNVVPVWSNYFNWIIG